MKVQDQGVKLPPPKTRPLQFKRGTAAAFKKHNPLLLKGEPAFEEDTNKMKVGTGKKFYNDLPYIGDHSKPKDGKSTYELWLEAGNEGTLDDFLEAQIGPAGASAYELWLRTGHEGSIVDFLDSLIGDSAYEVWIKAGHVGTVEDFLDSLKGKSAYEVWLDQGYVGTEQDYLDWLRTTSWVYLDGHDPYHPDDSEGEEEGDD